MALLLGHREKRDERTTYPGPLARGFSVLVPGECGLVVCGGGGEALKKVACIILE